MRLFNLKRWIRRQYCQWLINLLLNWKVSCKQRHVILEVDEEARAWLAKNGYDKKMGARPMARLIQEQIKKPLAEEIIVWSIE